MKVNPDGLAAVITMFTEIPARVAAVERALGNQIHAGHSFAANSSEASASSKL